MNAPLKLNFTIVNDVMVNVEGGIFLLLIMNINRHQKTKGFYTITDICISVIENQFAFYKHGARGIREGVT